MHHRVLSEKQIDMPFSDTEHVLLKSAVLLQDIPPDVLQALPGEADVRLLNLQADEVFLHAGSTDAGLYLIVHGLVELFIVDREQREKVLDFVRTGGTLGEETLFGQRALQYSVRSLTHAAVCYLPDRLIARWAERYPAFSRRLLSLVSARINFMYKDMLTFCTKKATARLVCYIVCHFDHAPQTPDGSYSLQLAIPRNRLASRLGVSDSHLSRSFRELQEQGLIVAQGRGFFIPDVPALSRYVCPAGCDF